MAGDLHDIYAFGALVLLAYSPPYALSGDLLLLKEPPLYDSSKHSCKYLYLALCVCSAGVHDTISMCYIGRRDVSHVCFSANVSQPTAQPQQEK